MPHNPYRRPSPYQQPLQGLQGAAIQQDQYAPMSPMGANDPITLQGLQESRLREMTRNLELQKNNPLFRTGATPSDVGFLAQDIEESPFTGVGERERVGALQGLQEQARLGGFESPQAASLYGRQQAERKMTLPLEEARIAGEFDLRKQQEASRGALDVMREQQRGQEAIYGQNPLAAFLQGGQAPAGVRSLSLGRQGSVSFEPEQRISPQVLNQVRVARQLAQKQGLTGVFGEPSEGAAGLNQAIEGALYQHPAAQDTKDLAREVLQSPLRNAPIETILERAATAGQPLDPTQAGYLRELLSLMRGL